MNDVIASVQYADDNTPSMTLNTFAVAARVQLVAHMDKHHPGVPYTMSEQVADFTDAKGHTRTGGRFIVATKSVTLTSYKTEWITRTEYQYVCNWSDGTETTEVSLPWGMSAMVGAIDLDKTPIEFATIDPDDSEMNTPRGG